MSVHSTTLPRSPESVSAARRLVHTHTPTLGSQHRQDAVLMVSELVTNALAHGIGTISLRIDVSSDALRVEVSDEGNVRLEPSPTPGAHGGWGLRIVDQLADDWGVLEGSTKVWFRLGPPPPNAETHQPRPFGGSSGQFFGVAQWGQEGTRSQAFRDSQRDLKARHADHDCHQIWLDRRAPGSRGTQSATTCTWTPPFGSDHCRVSCCAPVERRADARVGLRAGRTLLTLVS